jgi:hypothetical protein
MDSFPPCSAPILAVNRDRNDDGRDGLLDARSSSSRSSSMTKAVIELTEVDSAQRIPDLRQYLDQGAALIAAFESAAGATTYDSAKLWRNWPSMCIGFPSTEVKFASSVFLNVPTGRVWSPLTLEDLAAVRACVAADVAAKKAEVLAFTSLLLLRGAPLQQLCHCHCHDGSDAERRLGFQVEEHEEPEGPSEGIVYVRGEMRQRLAAVLAKQKRIVALEAELRAANEEEDTLNYELDLFERAERALVRLDESFRAAGGYEDDVAAGGASNKQKKKKQRLGGGGGGAAPGVP